MNLKEVINRISQARQKANLSARALSLRIDKDDSYIAKVEAGKIVPSIDIILQIIDACDTTAEQFFYRDFLKYPLDKEILDYFSRLDESQKKAILSLYK